MNSRKPLEFRRDQACLARPCSKGFALRSFACNVHKVKLRWIDVPFQHAAFRNPSPWRQSGARLHLLPLFFIMAEQANNFERDTECLNSQKSLQHLFWSPVLRVATQRLITKFKVQQQARPLAHLQAQLSAEAIPTSQRAPSLAASLARLSQLTNLHSARSNLAARLNTYANAVLPLSGRAAFCVAT